MKYKTYSFRHAETVLNEPAYINQYKEVISVIENITEANIIEKHNSYGGGDAEKSRMSISKAINDLLKERFVALDWTAESGLFQNKKYLGDTWRLDFAKKDISIEVGFNHGTVIAWNLIKPVLASELNHVEKAIQTKVGIIITATKNLKQKGGFDGAIGTFEKFLDYLPPLMNLLASPLLIIGLEAPETFIVEKEQLLDRKKIGKIRML